MNYLIIEESASSLKKKRLAILIEHNSIRRKAFVSLAINKDSDAFINENWAELWSSGESVSDDVWDEHEESQFTDLYKAVIRAGVQTARQQGSSLSDVSAAMTAMVDASPRSAQLLKLKTLASNATAAERDEFLIICAFLFLSKTLGEK